MIRRCAYCNGEVVERFAGDEGWSVCTECDTIEPEEYEGEDDDD